MLFDDPQLFHDPQPFDDPQSFDDQLEVWTLIIQKYTVIPPSLMMVLLLRKFLRHGNFKNIDKVSISNTPLGGIDKAMMDDVKRDWEE